MLTVDFDRLGLRRGDLVLDMGCGAGRHAFECLRRGARTVALDYSHPELIDVAGTFGAMVDAGEVPGEPHGGPVRGDALRLPFPDSTFDRIIVSEVLEHIPDDRGAISELVRVLRPGGTMAATVPSWFPEQVCWRLSDAYHAPIAEGGHVRIYRRRELTARLEAAGLITRGSHHAHALHSPYWWLKCAVGPTNDDHRLVKAYRRFLEWDIIEAPRTTRWADRLLNPVLGKSIVIYTELPHSPAGDGEDTHSPGVAVRGGSRGENSAA